MSTKGTRKISGFLWAMAIAVVSFFVIFLFFPDVSYKFFGVSVKQPVGKTVSEAADTSLLFLAEHLADDGDINRARRYVEFAKDCNYFFCPRLHNYQVNSVIKVIEKSNQANQSRANLMLIIASVVIVLLLVVLFFTVFRLRRNSK